MWSEDQQHPHHHTWSESQRLRSPLGLTKLDLPLYKIPRSVECALTSGSADLEAKPLLVTSIGGFCGQAAVRRGHSLVEKGLLRGEEGNPPGGELGATPRES